MLSCQANLQGHGIFQSYDGKQCGEEEGSSCEREAAEQGHSKLRRSPEHEFLQLGLEEALYLMKELGCLVVVLITPSTTSVRPPIILIQVPLTLLSCMRAGLASYERRRVLDCVL